MTNATQKTRRPTRAFSLVELMVAGTIVSLVSVAFLAYMRFAAVTAINITNQSVYAQQAGNTASLIVQRTRLCHSFTVQDSGYTLVLNIDDAPGTDADGDGNKYNDTDHQETFRITDADGSLATLADNTLTYQATAAATAKILARRVSQIASAPFFTATSSKEVAISFAISGGTNSANGQRVEILTSAFRLN